VDFFKNNFAFTTTNQGKESESGEPIRKWIDTMANHGSTVRRWAGRVGVDKVEEFIDVCLSLENLIDPQRPFLPPKQKVAKKELEFLDEEAAEEPGRLRVEREYMEEFINPKEFVEKQREKLVEEREARKKMPEQPDRDVLGFLLDHAPLERWERDVLWAIRAEAYYFWPQMQTKIMNEGWACVGPETLVHTSQGLVTMREVVEAGAIEVSDGETMRRVYGRNVILDRRTITLTTRRGHVVTGSDNHRIMRPDGSWVRLEQVARGERVKIAGGCDAWPTAEVEIRWQAPVRISLDDVAKEAGTSLWTVLRHRAGKTVRAAAPIASALRSYESEANQALPHAMKKRAVIRVPRTVDERLGAFLGYLVGDGHVSKVKRTIGLTTGDAPQAECFAALARELFDVTPRTRLDGNRQRVTISSEALSDLLTDGLGLTHGPSAEKKEIPSCIRRSPEPVVRAFLRAYFDCDGHAGKDGVILVSKSPRMSEQVQLLLLTYGVLSRRRRSKDGTYRVEVKGASAERFAARVGFGLTRKTEALAAYVAGHRWFKRESWEDEIVSITEGRGDVYDISVEATHRYAAAGLVHHNSFWHSKLMTEKVCDDGEIIEYAERNAGVMETGQGRLNPYKLGVELYRSVEDRWNKGQYGKEWEDCDDLEARRTWNRRTGEGRKKLFEVRKLYTDVTFIDEFLTPDFVVEHKMYSFGWNQRNERFEIETRKFKEVKEKLLFQLTNAGQPFISVEDANLGNRGELLLRHDHMGIDLKIDWAREVLRSLVRIWRRPVEIHTRIEGKPSLLRFDGKEHVQRPLK
jgi:stage V sporulation protein R